jgi:endo-1,4-beta-xylanase
MAIRIKSGESNKFILPVFILTAIVVFSIVLGCVSSGAVGGGKEIVVYQEDFESYAGGWMPRGSASVAVVSGKAHSGTKSLYVSSRSKTWHGAIYSLVSLKPGQTYRVSVWVMFNDDSAPAQGINISIQQNVDGQGETYSTIGAERVPKGEWTYIEGEYTVPRSRFEMAVSLYFESTYKSDENTQPSDTFSFYADDIVITRLPPMPPPEVEKDIPALYTFFEDSFPLGTAIDRRYLDPSNIHHDMLRHFNAYVYGNEMKPDALEPSEGRFNWSNADALMEYAARNNKKVRGHTLIWHSQTPSWMFQGSGPNGLATKDQLYARMERHIREVVSHYKGKIYTWDVVNEAIGDDGGLRDSRYYQISGSHEYIAKAFRWAHEADPDALLCLNDFSIEAASAKQDGFYNLIQTLLDEGVPVHVAGIQAHISNSWPTVADLRQTIRRLASLGVKVQITELDMSIYADGGEPKKRADRDVLLEQAAKYRALFDMFREEAKEGNLDMVMVWGIADDDTWLNNHPVPGRTDYPLFFGKDLKAKPAYWVLVDPSRMPIQLKRIDATRTNRPPVGIQDPAWAFVSPRNIQDKQGNIYGWFKVMWDDNNIYAQVHANSRDTSGKLRFFIEPKNQKLEERSDTAFTLDFNLSNAVPSGSGVAMLAVIPFEGKQEARVGFDFRLESGNTIHSWNDYDNTQEISSLNYGTINLRLLPPVTYARQGTIDMSLRATRDLDPAWEAAAPVQMNVKTMGHTEDGSQFRVLWDSSYLYVLVEVIDPVLDDKSTIVHEQDTVEVFVDQNNGKTAIYEPDDGQYRVSFRNFASFNGGDSSRFRSRTMLIPGGYRVEMAIPLYAIKPAPGTLLGFDVQVNDASNGARAGIRNWVSDTNMGYQSTADYGVLMLRE